MAEIDIFIDAAPIEIEISAAQGIPGVAGAAGPNSVTSTTTSNGTANLLLSNVETVTATVTDTLTAPHIHGNLAGSVYAHIRAGEALEKGDPVYVSGFHPGSSTAEVMKADASNAAKMPAIGIMDANVAHNNTGHMVITGTITELDTAGLTVNAELYVAAGGGMTGTPPTARAQPVARVERANANNGAVIVKVNGLSASDATGNTLVRRTATGGASFAGINTNSGSYSQVGGANFNVATTTAANLTATGSGTVTVSGAGGTTISGGALTISASSATFATGSIATSQPLALTQTWTNAAVTYTGLQVNITDTASNAASLLADFQVGGSSRFAIGKTGFTFRAATIFAGISSDGSGRILLNSSTAGGVRVSGDLQIGLSDTVLLRDGAANTLAQRNGTAQQESRIYGTYTGAGDYRRLALKMDTAGVAQIVAEGAGSGASGNVLQLPSNTTFADAPATRTALGLGTGDSPTFAITNASTGFYGTDARLVTTSGGVMLLGSSFYFTWGASTPTSTKDTSLSRLSAGVLGVGTGTVGSTAGSLSLTNLTASGNVGIGTTSPGSGLHVSGALGSNTTTYDSAAALKLTNTAGNSWLLTSGVIGVINGSFSIRQGSTALPALTIAATTNNVGIGTTSPASKLDVVGAIKASATVQTGGYTFANLPSPATQGMRAYITDGAALPLYMANAAGGGSTVTPVFYNGTNWINA